VDIAARPPDLSGEIFLSIPSHKPQPKAEIHCTAITGCLLGTAVGDALGLACEGLSRSRQRKLFPDLSRPNLLFGRGMVSDDTEHACMVAQALLVSGGDVERFTRHLAHELRLWLFSIPAGVGFATLRATGKLCLGISPERSGVFSAGNGPAMRSPLLGVCYGEDIARLRKLVRASTRLTHTDPKAEYGAFAVALAAHFARQQQNDPTAYQQALRAALGDEANELHDLVAKVVASVNTKQTTEDFAAEIGHTKGVSGYIYHTVPVVLHAALRNPTDFRAAVMETIRCGGDTDTTGAIAGSIVGAGVGNSGIPSEWVASLWEWPRSVAWMERLSERLAEVVQTGRPQTALPLFRLGQLARNGVFLSAVLAHGFRRLMPPY
jgi:ADP-ribosyl-[dinitrogen reductase] hydrolase